MGLALALAASIGVGCAAAWGQEKGARVSFQFDRTGLETPRYTMTVGEDGRTTYHAELAAKGEAAGAAIEKELTLSTGTTAKIFELARAADLFRVTCASKLKNIADTGKKMLRYVGPEGAGECLFNYSEIKPVVTVTEIFLNTETTLEAGRRLDFKRRFDRLGLDAEMITLGNMLEAHQASGLETIVPTLRAIANDTELLQRVRSRAEKMLQQADAGK